MELLRQLNKISEAVAPRPQQPQAQPQQGQQQAAQPQAQPQAQPRQRAPRQPKQKVQPQQPQQQQAQAAQPQPPPPIVQGAPLDPYTQIKTYIEKNPGQAQAVIDFISRVRRDAVS